MKKSGFCSVFKRRLLPLLLFLFVAFSCKSAAPSPSAAALADVEAAGVVEKIPPENSEPLPVEAPVPMETPLLPEPLQEPPIDNIVEPAVDVPPEMPETPEAPEAEELPEPWLLAPFSEEQAGEDPSAAQTELPPPVPQEQEPLPQSEAVPLPEISLPPEPVEPPRQSEIAPRPEAEPQAAPQPVPQPVPRESPPPPKIEEQSPPPAEPELQPEPQPQPEFLPPPQEPVHIPELPGRITPESSEEQIVFSRTARLMVGQILEIPFRGTGWVYLGELGSRRGLSYDSRRLDTAAGITEGQSFIFIAQRAGTFVLKFYKQDFIQDYIINDYVQVIVGESYPGTDWPGSPTDQGRVIANPRWPPVSGSAVPGGVPEPRRPAPAAETRPAPLGESTQAAPPEPPLEIPAPDLSPAEYVRRAREEFDAGRVEAALTILDTMRQQYPLGTDEAWWLYGQLLEANSPGRDIRLALEYYRRLVREYPQSPRAGEARQRIAYLERYYLNIR